MEPNGETNLRGAAAGLGRAFIDLLYPPACGLCSIRLHRFEQVVCDACRTLILPSDAWRCALCGATGDCHPPAPGARCSFCPPVDSHYLGVLAATHYREPSARCVRLFKYHRRFEMGGLMADMMAATLGEAVRNIDDRIRWVVPVPLHWTRRIVRGFNQSDALARRLAQAVEKPYEPGLLSRRKRTKMQTRVRPEDRERNVHGAFKVRRPLGDGRPGVLLVDDVVTSGHTVEECARVLSEAGAGQIWVAAFARARPSEPPQLTSR